MCIHIFFILLVRPTCLVVECNSLSLKNDIVVSTEVCSEIRNLMAFEWAVRTMTVSNLVWNFCGMFSLNVTCQIVSSCENHVAITTLKLFIFLLFWCCFSTRILIVNLTLLLKIVIIINCLFRRSRRTYVGRCLLA